MLLLLLVICIAMFVGGILLYKHTRMDEGAIAITAIGCAVGILVFIAAMIVTGVVVSDSKLDARLEMYQEENAKIEQQIAEVVQQYQEYETAIFTEVTPESAMTLVTMYPELKSDTLVSSQIDIYVKNNEKIKELKLEKIDAPLYKWWLYFGG